MRVLPVRCSSLATVAVGVLLATYGSAAADVFDLSFQRLVVAPNNQVPPAPMGSFAQPDDKYNLSHGALEGYRQVISELGVGLAPRFLTTADTIGYSGFQFDIDYSLTTISNQKCSDGNANTANKNECPWQYGVEGKNDANGNHLSPPNMLHTFSVFARKGIWLPLPSFELGAGATKLLQSNLFAVEAYAKFALHEGFHDWPIPSLAVRGAVSRVLGESQIDLTMVQVDSSISKSFGIAGTVTIVPYAGAAWLYIIPRGQVLDLTPECDSYSGRGCPAGNTTGANSVDLNNNAVFPSTANENISRWRFFGGFRLNYNVLVLTADFAATIAATGRAARVRRPAPPTSRTRA